MDHLLEVELPGLADERADRGETPRKHPERGVAISPADIQPIIDAAVKFKVIPKAFAAQDVMCVCALRK